MNNLFQIRVTGVCIEDGKILLVKQKVNEQRGWSLPGGRMEHGETMKDAIRREMKEETGLDVSIERLLYLCEKQDCQPPLLHVTFLLKLVGGEITLPTNELDQNHIHYVKFVDSNDLCSYGFSERFKSIVEQGFPKSGSYQGDKSSIGL